MNESHAAAALAVTAVPAAVAAVAAGAAGATCYLFSWLVPISEKPMSEGLWRLVEWIF